MISMESDIKILQLIDYLVFN